MKHNELKSHLDNQLISVVRVVPIPLRRGWCVNVLLKELFVTGSRTLTLESDRSTRNQKKVRRFASIDSAGQYLKSLGVTSFQVETDYAAPEQEKSRPNPRNDDEVSVVELSNMAGS